MIPLQRASFIFGARSPWVRVSRPRSQHAPRNSSNSTARKDSSNPPPHPPNEVTIQSAKNEPLDVPIQLWYHRLGPVSTFFNWFHRTQVKRPYTVQLCTTLTTYLCGDLLAQDIGGELYDPTRTLRMLTIGAIAAIPGYKWFLFLGQNFNFSSKFASIVTKVLVNQAVFAPVFNTYFFGMQALLTGEPILGVIARVKAAVPVSVVNSLKLWPAVTAFSFWFIMPQYRFMFSGIFAVAWQAYLSYLNRKEEKIELATDTMSRPVVPESTVVK
ncbi:uncharacterized protein Z518_06917 [Rhinocladiella mackenziei CBS 650.93]|uniref:Uncharacterized protein n=1 Tax=Rhinocladiella mackenziei CBS 650.93 TaxID=1442369 RepID=A0A0D2J308_9EURO|nr:uncharacterized protein Z518_06917 [Rhinocladiella mackenziei CBS 650.93]KIX03365.1 hypothetical protein Z518_06917 [Rhinocladiella mackenziei CBS 650.93]